MRDVALEVWALGNWKSEPLGTAKFCPHQGLEGLCEELQGLCGPQLPVGNPSGFGSLQLPAERVRDIKEICEPVFGEIAPAVRWLLHTPHFHTG